MASALDVATVQFSDVFETATAIMHGVRSITMADSVTKKEAAAEFRRAKALATARGVTISVSSARLEGLLMNSGDADADAPAANLSTVLCLQPWSGFTVNADGHASYCCRHIVTTDSDITCYDSVREILNDVNAVQLREALLSGCPPERCSSCEMGQPSDPSRLRSALRSHLRTRALRARRSQLEAITRRSPLARAPWRTLRRIPPTRR
jgi:hypothetical protein